MAHAAKAEWAEAQEAFDRVTASEAATPEGVKGKTALSIAVHVLPGEIATRRGNLNMGITHFKEAAKIEDAGLYFEPSKWYYPVRPRTGAQSSGKEHRIGSSGSTFSQSLDGHRRDADSIEVLVDREQLKSGWKS